MKKNWFSSALACTLLCMGLMITFFAEAQSGMVWTEKKADKWVKERAWAHGLTLKLHPSASKTEFAKQYEENKAVWDKAFAFLKEHDLQQLAPGKYPIDGDEVYAMVTENPTKEMDQTNWESHRKYLDLQYVIAGKEKIGVAPVAKATVTKEYDESKDLANYKADGKFYLAEPGTFFLFFPQNAHRPNVKVDGTDKDKKIVIKIRYKSRSGSDKP